MRNKALLVVVGILLVGVSGCSAPSGQQDRADEVRTSEAPAGDQPNDDLTPAGVDEYVTAVLACMQERGWSGTRSADSVQWDPVPLDQSSQFNADNTECSEMNAGLVNSSEPLSDALFELNYDRVAAAHDCYLANGYQAEPLPTFQAWRDRLEQGQDYSISSVERESNATSLGEIEAVCPDPAPYFFDATTKIYADAVNYEAYRASTTP